MSQKMKEGLIGVLTLAMLVVLFIAALKAEETTKVTSSVPVAQGGTGESKLLLSADEKVKVLQAYTDSLEKQQAQQKITGCAEAQVSLSQAMTVLQTELNEVYKAHGLSTEEYQIDVKGLTFVKIPPKKAETKK